MTSAHGLPKVCAYESVRKVDDLLGAAPFRERSEVRRCVESGINKLLRTTKARAASSFISVQVSCAVGGVWLQQREEEEEQLAALIAIATQAEMEAFVRGVQSRLTEELWDSPVHVVLGGPQPDVDTVAATLCLALHLSLKQQSDVLVVPVLCGGDVPQDTCSLLATLGLSKGLLLRRDHLDLLSLQERRPLTLTLLRDGLLQGSELRALQPSVRRVVHSGDPESAGSLALMTVAREILQEAPEHVGLPLGPTLREALLLQREALWLQHGQHSEEVEEILRLLEQVRHRKPAKLPDWEQLLTKEPKEFSDGEMTIVLTAVTTETKPSVKQLG
uniref:Uncharacterized protein n=1 Tax=Knipowitschia caucasica TaxID=637954 RepID=A0AAV2MR83_KNICA